MTPKNSEEKAVNPTKKHSMKCPKLYGNKCSCDGYHTFDELYEHRIELFIQLCKKLQGRDYITIPDNKDTYWHMLVWRSKVHFDGSCYDGWFTLGYERKNGKQITYHLPLSKWEETEFAETLEKAPEFDGHTGDDVLKRLKTL